MDADKEQRKKIRNLVIAVFVPVALCMLLLFLLFPPGSSTENRLDRIPEDFSRYDLTNTAAITNEELILFQLESTVRSEQLAQDLYAFAKATYSKYQGDYSQEVIGFEIEEESISLDENTLSFTGQFGTRDSDNVSVSVEILPNERIRTTIEEDGKKLSGSELPSQEAVNAFIAELPIYENRFAVEYIQQSGIFHISIFDPDPELASEAVNFVEERMNRELNTSEYNLIFPNTSGEDIRYPEFAN